MEKNKTIGQKQGTQNNSSNVEWWFYLPDGSYSVLNIQDYIDYILKNHETLPNNSPTPFFYNNYIWSGLCDF